LEIQEVVIALEDDLNELIETSSKNEDINNIRKIYYGDNEGDLLVGTMLMFASFKGYISSVNLLLEKNAKINIDYDQTEYNNLSWRTYQFYNISISAIKLAFLVRNYNIVKILAQHKFCKYNIYNIIRFYRDITYEWPELYTVTSSTSQEYNNIIKLLISSKKQSKLELDKILIEVSYDGNLEFLLMLIKMGANIKTPHDESKALFSACENGKFETAKYLIENGVSIKVETLSGKFTHCLHIAIKSCNIKLFKYIVKKSRDVDFVNFNGILPINVAIENDNLIFVKYLIKKGAHINRHDQNGKYPLSVAIDNGNLQIVKYLVSSGADVNMMCQYYRSPGDKAVTLLERAIYNKQNEIANYFIDKCVIFSNKKNNANFLTCACESNDLELLKCLSEIIGNCLPYKLTNILHSEICKFSSFDVIKYIFNTYPVENINEEHEGKNTYLFYLAQNNSDDNSDSINHLIQLGADVNHINTVGESVLFKCTYGWKKCNSDNLQCFIENGANLDYVMKVENNKLITIKEFLEPYKDRESLNDFLLNKVYGIKTISCCLKEGDYILAYRLMNIEIIETIKIIDNNNKTCGVCWMNSINVCTECTHCYCNVCYIAIKKSSAVCAFCRSNMTNIISIINIASEVKIN
jgi:ankyrin repeat protein